MASLGEEHCGDGKKMVTLHTRVGTLAIEGEEVDEIVRFVK